MHGGILVCGLNGAGKSSLAKVLANKLNYCFIDIEDLCFSKEDNPDYPYETARTCEETVALLCDVTEKKKDFVLASVTGDFGKTFLSRLLCVVYISLPREARLKRIYERSNKRFGSDAQIGGKYYKQIKAFHTFCESREESLVEDWLQNISCPVIRVNGTKATEENIRLIISQLKAEE